MEWGGGGGGGKCVLMAGIMLLLTLSVINLDTEIIVSWFNSDVLLILPLSFSWATSQRYWTREFSKRLFNNIACESICNELSKCEFSP